VTSVIHIEVHRRTAAALKAFPTGMLCVAAIPGLPLGTDPLSARRARRLPVLKTCHGSRVSWPHGAAERAVRPTAAHSRSRS
jgi:hypothetical protein